MISEAKQKWTRVLQSGDCNGSERSIGGPFGFVKGTSQAHTV